MLLPGYIALILGLMLIEPKALFGPLYETSSPLSDLFLIVVFIVAGPAIGFTLWQFNLQIVTVGFALLFRRRGKTHEFVRAYLDLKMRSNNGVRTELDAIEAQYQFFMSTGIAIIIIDLVYFCLSVLKPKSVPYSEGYVILGNDILRFDNTSFHNTSGETLLILLLFFAAVALILSAIHYNRAVRTPLICDRLKENGLCVAIEVCRESEKRNVKILYDRAKNFLKKDEKIDRDIGLEYLTKAAKIDEEYIKRMYLKDVNNNKFNPCEKVSYRD